MKFSVSLKKNQDFRRLYSKGRSIAAASLVVYVKKNRQPVNRLGITVSTKIGNAVCRNKIRRRLKEIYRLNEGRLESGLDVVIVARVKAAHTPYSKLERDYLYACSRLGILKKETESGGNL
ncbi:MAG: ribonuclease P protein component [Clostridiales bacterium]|nr:ribonuclease P protein component [Clostridiales bacterium]